MPETLHRLRARVAALEEARTPLCSAPLSGDSKSGRLALGVPEMDALTGGGLSLADMHEVRCSASRDIACATGFVAGLLAQLMKRSARDGPVFWVSEGAATFEAGFLYAEGLSWFGVDPGRIIHVHPRDLGDALWAAGEVARSGNPVATVFHVKGNQRVLDLAVSRKLMLRAQTGGAPLFLLRQAGEEEASSAATRWHVAPAPSLPDAQFERGVGHMRLALSLEKNRNGQTGHWQVAWNPEKRSFEHAANPVSPRDALPHPRLPLHAPADRPHPAAALGKGAGPSVITG